MALVVVGLNLGGDGHVLATTVLAQGTSTTDLPASSLFFRNLAIAGNTDPAASVVAADGAGTTGGGMC